jgi:hypothetical protein
MFAAIDLYLSRCDDAIEYRCHAVVFGMWSLYHLTMAATEKVISVARLLMSKMTFAGEDHWDAILVACLNNFLILF